MLRCRRTALLKVLRALMLLLIGGCQREAGVVSTERFVEVQGSTGTLVAPEKWQLKDGGDHWSVTSPDGMAVINVMTFTVEGSGSLDDVAQMVADNLTDPKPHWHDSDWTPLKVQGRSAIRRSLKPSDEAAQGEWVVIALREGDLYHVLSLNASDPAMELNGEFYESVMLTFKGISSPPKKL